MVSSAICSPYFIGSWGLSERPWPRQSSASTRWRPRNAAATPFINHMSALPVKPWRRTTGVPGLTHRPIVELDAVVRGEPTVLGRRRAGIVEIEEARQDLGVDRAHGGEVPAVGQHVAPEGLELALHARDLLVGLVERAVDREHRHLHAREIDAVALAGLPGVLAQRAQRCFVVAGVLALRAQRARLARRFALAVGRELRDPLGIDLGDAGPAVGRGDDAVRMAIEQLGDDAAAHRVAVHVRALEAQMIHQRDHVLRHARAVRIRIVRLVALAVTAAVEREDAVVARELLAPRRSRTTGTRASPL